jgi:hypothetical protein
MTDIAAMIMTLPDGTAIAIIEMGIITAKMPIGNQCDIAIDIPEMKWLLYPTGAAESWFAIARTTQGIMSITPIALSVGVMWWSTYSILASAFRHFKGKFDTLGGFPHCF